MVDRRITDGTRIGQLLASELTGLETGVMAAVDVVDADPAATPSADGTEAYRIARDGTVVAAVRLYPESVEVCLSGERAWPDGTPTRDTVTVADARTLQIADGAGVKTAVDAVRVTLAAEDA
jgi:hypothetical protein